MIRSSFSLSTLIPALLISSSATAAPWGGGGDKVGGGGDVFECTRPNGQKIYQLLDIAEAQPRGLPVDLGGDKLSIQEKIDLVAARLAELDPDRAAKYRTEVMKMHEDVTLQEQGLATKHGLAMLQPDLLQDYDDSKETFKKTTYLAPEGVLEQVKCDKHQLVFQKDPMNALDPAYEFQRGFWLKLDADNRVATYYHEAIYREMRKAGHTDSRSVRSFNSWLFSGKIASIGSALYADLLWNAKITTLNLYGQVVISTDPTGELKRDERGEIVRVSRQYAQHAIYEVRVLPDLILKMSDLELSDGGVRRGVNHSALAYEGERVASSSDGFASGGTVEISNGSVRILGMKKPGDIGGRVSLEIGADRRARVLEESEFWKPALDEKTKDDLRDLLLCSRAVVQKSIGGTAGIQKMGELLVQARGALAASRPNEIESLRSECRAYRKSGKKRSSREERLNAANGFPEETVRSILSSFASPQPKACHGYGASLRAEAGLGAQAGIYAVTCRFSDGSRILYFGPSIGFMVGIGAEVHAGRIDFVDGFGPDTGIHAGRAGFSAGSSRQYHPMFLLGAGNAETGTLPEPDQVVWELPVTGHASREKSVAVGVNVVGRSSSDWTAGIRLLKFKGGVDRHIDELVSKILTQK